MIAHTHGVSLVVASIVVSMVASITALALMNNMRTLPETKRKALIVMAAFVLGGGIWSMHFLAMLSLQFSVPIHYDLLQTLGSGLIAVLVVGFALLLLHFRARTRAILNLAGVSLGIGIVSMHYIGMLGMRGVIPTFNGVAMFASFIVALVMGVAAIRVSYGARSRQNIVKGGIVFGLSVVVVHFTAMVGAHFSIDPDYSQLTVAIDQGILAIAVTVTAFVICGTFLLAASTFISADQPGPAELPLVHTDANPLPAGDTDNPRQQPVDSPETRPAPEASQSPEQTLATSLPTRPERKSDRIIEGRPDKSLEDHPDESAEQGLDHAMRTSVVVRIPYEEHKQIAFVSSDEVGVIRADGRYTQIYSQAGVKFCPWSISEAERRLAGADFFRSHRSYLINISKVEAFEKSREAGICRFNGFANLGSVPVSRTRVTEIVERLGL